MSQLKRLVVSILQFLQDQLQSSLFAADAKECLEVAMHCLETVFGVKFNDPSVAGLLASRPLLDIFTEVVRTEQSLSLPKTKSSVNLEVNCQDSLMPKQIKGATHKSFTPTIIENGSWHMEEASSNDADNSYSMLQPLALTNKEKDRLSDPPSPAESPPFLENYYKTLDELNFNEPTRPLDLSRETTKHFLERLPPKRWLCTVW
ncbi:uncharacterized protein LOC143223258 isoform X2 [Tachypleus tridentatus]|uniref:uncharacterized protein LOC143223258 isoform X2 n=1 Tax=Tachypleus tridentatus TaxID=6853 RepID=UPI003FD61886